MLRELMPRVEGGMVDSSGAPDYAKMRSDDLDAKLAAAKAVQAAEKADDETAKGFDMLELKTRKDRLN